MLFVSPDETKEKDGTKIVCVSYIVGGVEKSFQCSTFPALIGRDSSNVDIPILHPSVSRTHCRLLVSDETVLIEDVGSSNGTFINGQRIREATPFTNDDAITIGDVKVCIRTKPATALEEG